MISLLKFVDSVFNSSLFNNTSNTKNAEDGGGAVV